jgi:hypothetical protein
MNEIRQLCTVSSSLDKHLDEILELFHACPPEHLLPSLSLIGQSISCMSIEQFDVDLIGHQLFRIIRQWSERLFQLWLVNGTLNGEEYRALFYTHQWYKLLAEWVYQQNETIIDNDHEHDIQLAMTNLFVDVDFICTFCRVITQLIAMDNISLLKTMSNTQLLVIIFVSIANEFSFD